MGYMQISTQKNIKFMKNCVKKANPQYCYCTFMHTQTLFVLYLAFSNHSKQYQTTSNATCCFKPPQTFPIWHDFCVLFFRGRGLVFPTVARRSTDSRPTAERQSDECQATVRRQCPDGGLYFGYAPSIFHVSSI